MNRRIFFLYFFRSKSWKIFFSFFLSLSLSFFETGSLLSSSSSKFIIWNIFYLLSHLFHLSLILFFFFLGGGILMFEKFILVDIVVLIQEFFYLFLKTL